MIKKGGKINRMIKVYPSVRDQEISFGNKIFNMTIYSCLCNFVTFSVMMKIYSV